MASSLRAGPVWTLQNALIMNFSLRFGELLLFEKMVRTELTVFGNYFNMENVRSERPAGLL